MLVVLAAVWGSVVGYALLGGQLHLRLRGGPIDLVRAAIWGVVAVYGLRIVGDLLHVLPVFGILGGFLNVITIIAMAVLATLGAGALVRTEYQRRTVQDWWQRTRPARPSAKRRDDDFPPPPAPEPASAPAPPPPAPPQAFAPPPAPPADPPAPIA